MKKSKKATVADTCVSCGACVKECPLGALSIWKGIVAKVESDKCVGCGKCLKICPANAISISILEVYNHG